MFDGVNTTNQPVTVNVLNVVETKFYVVDDGSANRTYEYEAARHGHRELRAQQWQQRSRGAASTAAGDRVWVVDNNRKVYIYNTSGGLLGSWTAGTLASTATPEGIATNGTDVWIVDAKSDKVFRYAGAASRLSGSQNAASSFNLNSSNGSPRDIVTDGASLWVVNDAGTDKVSSTRWPAASSEAGPSTRPTRRRPESRSTRPTSATSGSSTAAPTASINTPAPRPAPPAANPQQRHSHWPRAIPIRKASPIHRLA